MINKSSIEILSELIEASIDAADRLDKAQQEANLGESEKLKEMILDFQKKIADILK